jgi:hypothetical protein
MDVPSRNQQIALDWTRNWSNNLVNQARFGYVRLGVFFQGGTFPNCTVAAFSSGVCPTLVTFAGGFGGVNSVNIGVGNNLPQNRVVNNSQWQDNASWQHGRHTVKFGGEYDRQRSPDNFLPQFNGQYSFPDFNSFLQNAPTTLQLGNGNPVIPFREQDASLYLGDDWRFKENLTLNLGIRWEFNQNAINQLAAQTIARQSNPATAFWDTSLPLSVTTVPKIPNVWTNFAPNIGFAWTPHVLKGLLGENKTVLRGGFRMAYDPAFYNIFLNVATAAPVINLGTLIPGSNVTPCTAPCLVGPFGSDVRGVHLNDIPTGAGINPGARNQTRVTSDFHNPYAEEWTFGVQREVTNKIAAEVRYVGNHTVGEFQTINGNPLLSGLIANGFSSFIPAGFTPCPSGGSPSNFARGRANCNFTNLRIRANSAFANYNSLQSQVKLMTWHGFSGVASYTWSKNIDNASEIFSSFSANTVAGAQNPFDTARGERALSALDYPHNLSVYWQYELPFAKGQQGKMGRLFGGWSLAGTYRYLSGQLWSPAQTVGTSTSLTSASGLRAQTSCQNSYDSAFFSSFSTCRPFLSNANAPVDTVGIYCNGNRSCPSSSTGLAGVPAGTLVSLYDPCIGTATAHPCAVTPINPSSVYWIYNNNPADAVFGTPYSPVRRNWGGRGDSVNTVNLNLLKRTRVSERVNLKLEANLINAFNRMFRGVPDPVMIDGNFNANGSFGNTFFNDSGGLNPIGVGNTQAAIGNGLAQRRLILGAHVIF